MKAVRFARETQGDFIFTLRQRVNEYFTNNKTTIHGDTQLVIKTIALLGIYLLPYFLMVFGVITNPWLIFVSWVVMGVGMAGLGLSVMHDAIHGSYSKNPRVNKFIGNIIYLIGGNAANWKIQHNRLHHSFTNVDGMDDDINVGFLMRFSPNQKKYKLHKYQHLYAWFLYGFLTLSWITSKDFLQHFKYKKQGLTRGMGGDKKLLTELIIWKVVYYAFILVLPLLFIQAPIWVTIVSFLAMHFVAGLILSSVFQLAHVMPTSEYPIPDEKGSLENTWAIHQMLTTANFSEKSNILSWYVGGLNYQIEHHLFPNICHVHYKKLSKIVRETAKEYQLEYYSQKNFVIALWNHAKMLKQLGTAA